MISYQEFYLDNGLRVLVHEDPSTPMAVLNILYNVGSRDEDESMTGFAHLFEHLMFGGSTNIPNYDEMLQRVGGENNAFTSPDVTNYYVSVLANNIETAFWLESDRMLSLSFDSNVLEVQRKVVIEEFKQRYLNQPYGDVWLKLRPLAYQVHPYKWATIGKEISHIENATMDDVKHFYFKFYRPTNAVMVVAGNVKFEQIKRLSQKWFGPIPSGDKYHRNLLVEPRQMEARTLHHEANTPLDALYKVYHMCDRLSADYFGTDLLSDILGHGQSSRLYQRLVKKDKLFSSLSSQTVGSFEPGLFYIEGKLSKGTNFEIAEEALENEIEKLLKEGVNTDETIKVKNQAVTTLLYGEMEILNRAMNLAFATVLKSPDLVNTEAESISNVTENQINTIATTVLQKNNCSTLYYKSNSTN